MRTRILAVFAIAALALPAGATDLLHVDTENTLTGWFHDADNAGTYYFYVDGTAVVTYDGTTYTLAPAVALTVGMTGDLALADDGELQFGGGTDSVCLYDTAQTPDSLVCGLGTDSERLVVTTKALVGTDLAFADAGTPTVSITDATGADVLELSHDGTNAVINTDAGVVSIPDGASFGDVNLTNIGNAALDSVSPDGTDISITIGAGELGIGDGTYAFGNSPNVGVEGILEVDGATYLDGGVTTAAATATGLSVSDGDVTNVGDIALDSVSPDGTDISITIGAGELGIGDGTYAFGNSPNVGVEGILEVDGACYLDGGVTTAAATATSLSVSDGNVTNVGDVALDSISPDGTNISITIGAGEVGIGDGTYAFGNSPNFGVEGILEVDGACYLDGGVTTAAATATSLSVSDGNITNVGDISLDTISADNTTIQVTPAALTSGGTDDYGLQIAQTLNDSGAAGGSDEYRGLKVDVTTTDTTGWDTVYLLDLQDDSSSQLSVDISGNLLTSGTIDTGAATVDSLSVSDANVTNVGDIALDSITPDDGSAIALALDTAELGIHDGSEPSWGHSPMVGVEGALEVDGIVYADGGVTGNVTGDVTGSIAAATVSTTGATTTTNGVGAIGAHGVLVSESGGGKTHVTNLTFTNSIAPGGAVSLAGGAACYTFPAVRVLINGITIDGKLTSTGAGGAIGDTPDYGVGTAIASGANALLSDFGATAEDIITGLTSGAVAAAPGVDADAVTLTGLGAGLIVDASTAVYANFADAWTGADTVVFSGTMVIAWTEMD